MDSYRLRAEHLARFNAWESSQPRVDLGLEARIDAVSFLYDLLPSTARREPVESVRVSIRSLQSRLALLSVLS